MPLDAKFRNGVEYPILRFESRDYDLSTMSRQDLLDLRLRIEQEKTKIEAGISNRIATKHTTGQYTDPQSFAKANKAKRIMGLLLQHIQNEVGKRPKGNPKGNSERRLSDFFMDAAKFHLKGETFEMLLKDAQERKEAARETTLARG